MPAIQKTILKGGDVLEEILSVKDLEIQFTLRGKTLTPIRKVSLELYKGETLAIAGESGSGKTVLTKTFIGMLDNNGKITGGQILFDGKDLTTYKTEKQWLTIRGRRISMVFQDPMTSLNPLKTIGEQIRESMILHNIVPKDKSKGRVIELLNDVGIPDAINRYSNYPHQFSGGMRQRVVIAIAMACQPDILICDEPTTALDVTIQAQIIDLIKSLQKKLGITVIYITHDLGVVAEVADRVAIMYAGEFVEVGTAEEVFFDPRHPYTWALLSSLPQFGEKGKDLYTIEGVPPNLFKVIVGDAFAPRNRYALEVDFAAAPPYFKVSETHKAKTWLLDPRSPKIEPPETIAKLKAGDF
ncbi:MAG: ABC transporter ATP-binding protein [Clostridiales bacterium]|jgi:oligopeptide transport system ATP-binding protein|nr:ABC transporter ATP-binding protein [Clostridiales bacterium]